MVCLKDAVAQVVRGQNKTSRQGYEFTYLGEPTIDLFRGDSYKPVKKDNVQKQCAQVWGRLL